MVSIPRHFYISWKSWSRRPLLFSIRIPSTSGEQPRRFLLFSFSPVPFRYRYIYPRSHTKYKTSTGNAFYETTLTRETTVWANDRFSNEATEGKNLNLAHKGMMSRGCFWKILSLEMNLSSLITLDTIVVSMVKITSGLTVNIFPSSVRPSVCGIDSLWTYCMDFFQISAVPSPLCHNPRRVLNFWKQMIF